MAGRGRGKEVALQAEIESQEEWEEAISKEGLTVVDIYQEWCGPCKAMLSNFKRIKNESGDDLLRFAIAKADSVEALEKYRGKCEPCFLFFATGILVQVIRGVNSPQLMRSIAEQLEHEHKVIEGTAERIEIFDPKFPPTVGRKTEAMIGGLMFEEESESSSDEEEALTEAEIESQRGDMQYGDEIINYMDMPDERVSSSKSTKVMINKMFTVGVVFPDILTKVPEILPKIEAAGIEVVEKEEKTITEEEARVLLSGAANEAYYTDLLRHITKGPSLVMCLTKGLYGDTVVEDWNTLVGPPRVSEAQEYYPSSLRALFANPNHLSSNGFHASAQREDAIREVQLFFPDYVGIKVEMVHPATKVAKILALMTANGVRTHGEDAFTIKVKRSGVNILASKTVTITRERAMQFYKKNTEDPLYEELINSISSGPIMVMILTKDGEDVATLFNSVLGPKDIDTAATNEPNCLRAQLQVPDDPIVTIHGSEDIRKGHREVNFFFPIEECLLAIKPDAQKHKDEIIIKIRQAGFNIVAIRDMVLKPGQLNDLYGNCARQSFFPDLVRLMTSGVTTFICVTCRDCVMMARALVGTTDPAEAKLENPQSLRALFGTDILNNAVHVSSNVTEARHDIAKIFGVMDYDSEGLMLKRRRIKKQLGEIDDSASVGQDDKGTAEQENRSEHGDGGGMDEEGGERQEGSSRAQDNDDREEGGASREENESKSRDGSRQSGRVNASNTETGGVPEGLDDAQESENIPGDSAGSPTQHPAESPTERQSESRASRRSVDRGQTPSGEPSEPRPESAIKGELAENTEQRGATPVETGKQSPGGKSVQSKASHGKDDAEVTGATGRSSGLSKASKDSKRRQSKSSDSRQKSATSKSSK